MKAPVFDKAYYKFTVWPFDWNFFPSHSEQFCSFFTPPQDRF